MNALKQTGPLHDLGIPVNVPRITGAMIETMSGEPFDPAMEDEEHTELVE